MGQITAAEARQLLEGGNRRFAAGHPDHPHQDRKRREEVAAGQAPFAQVLTCADSRVAPELLFDAGLGDLFVIRVAGNILDDVVQATLQFGVEVVNIPLTVVMGHTSCAAIVTVVEAAGKHLPGSMSVFGDQIEPAVEQARTMEGDLVENAIRANINRTIGLLRNSSEAFGSANIVGAFYNMETGIVEFVD